jgi:tRNA pseudouridine55 synthase
MDGVLLIDKPSDMTSHDVVAKVRRILRVRRVGHTGTLDPFATGLLILLIGATTRLAQFLTGLEKEYEAVIRLGYATDTGDPTGKRIESEPAPGGGWTTQQIEAALESLRGDTQQVPPMYSAKKRAGRKLYELARAGEEIQRDAVSVYIHEFEAIPQHGELLKDNLDGTYDFETRVVCSAGTYIRTLAEDFGKQLGVGAYLSELRRTRIGDFVLDHAQTLEQLKVSFAEESLGTILLRPDEVLSRFRSIDLSDNDVRKVRNGVGLKLMDAQWSENERVCLRDSEQNLVAVAVFHSADQSLHPSVVLATKPE